MGAGADDYSTRSGYIQVNFDDDNEKTMDSDAYVLIMAKPGSLRRGLQSLISALNGIRAVGLVDHHAAALQMTQELHPALAILESDTSGNQILETLREIKHLSPQTKCIVLVDTVEKQQQAHLFGADAVILQGTAPDELVFTLEFLLNEAQSRKDNLSGEIYL